jgi:hypothetical protein
MIRYTVTERQLTDAINAASASWIRRAGERTEHFRQVGKYDESSSIWSEIKSVYMKIQHDKCAYCERQLEGKIEQDVEHFRPKNPVKKWPTVQMQRKLKYDFPCGDAWDEGYFLLSYHIWNYCTACKNCNTIMKSNSFPIAESRGPQNEDPLALLQFELPYLIYPLGDHDDDPEHLINFLGMLPMPVSNDITTHEYRRARVTIDFFNLVGRELLRQERAEKIMVLFRFLEDLDKDPTDEDAKFYMELAQDSRSTHVNCSNSFIKLYKEDRAMAENLKNIARDYLKSLRAPQPNQ